MVAHPSDKPPFWQRPHVRAFIVLSLSIWAMVTLPVLFELYPEFTAEKFDAIAARPGKWNSANIVYLSPVVLVLIPILLCCIYVREKIVDATSVRRGR